MNTMNVALKQSVKAVLASDAGWRLAAPVREAGAVALMYHRVNRDDDARFPGIGLAQFRDQMRWLRRNCTPVALDELFDAAAHAGRIRPPVLVTFDDGYRDYHDLAYPVLRELGIPAVVFLATDCMDRGGMLWTDDVHWATHASRKARFALPWERTTVLGLSDVAGRAAASAHCKRYLKALPDGERRLWLAALLEELDAPDVTRALGRQLLSWDEVRAAREGTRFGGHSHTHPILSRLAPEDMAREIRTCRERIAAETGEAPRSFAYPNGGAGDFNVMTQLLLRENGFETAFSTLRGLIGPRSDRLALHRQHAGGTTIGDFATLVARP